METLSLIRYSTVGPELSWSAKRETSCMACVQCLWGCSVHWGDDGLKVFSIVVEHPNALIISANARNDPQCTDNILQCTEQSPVHS